METYVVHGADKEVMGRKYGRDVSEVLDFSANINPFLLPNLEETVVEALRSSAVYPDSTYTDLRRALARYIGCDAEAVIPGNGATEILYLAMRVLKGKVGIVSPTFSEYERSAVLEGLEVVHFIATSESQFAFPLEEILEKLEEISCLVVCNPTNPTGSVYQLQEVARRLHEKGKLLIVDETFMEFVAQEALYSLIPSVQEYPNVLVVKAMTKFFGMPGVRLGYGVTSNKEMINQLYYYKEPWTINSFAEAIGKRLWLETAYKEKSKAYFIQARKEMQAYLKKLAGIIVYPTETNFLLIQLLNHRADVVKEELFLAYGLLVRDATNFIGLEGEWIRIAIRGPEENKQLQRILEAYFGTTN